MISHSSSLTRTTAMQVWSYLYGAEATHPTTASPVGDREGGAAETETCYTDLSPSESMHPMAIYLPDLFPTLLEQFSFSPILTDLEAHITFIRYIAAAFRCIISFSFSF